ncbi:hypothetical protein ACTXT7_000305 [Hymenolepis weldensis]
MLIQTFTFAVYGLEWNEANLIQTTIMQLKQARPTVGVTALKFQFDKFTFLSIQCTTPAFLLLGPDPFYEM